MKIHDFGRRGGSFDHRDSGSMRARRFRARYRVGDRLMGVVLTRPEHGLAWIDIQGHELLARISTTASPGQQLLFTVLRLHPEIVLQELSDRDGESLVSTVRGFLSARTSFETTFLGRNGPIPPDAIKDFHHRKSLFLHWLQSTTEGVEQYAGLVQLQADINSTLDREHSGAHYMYLPWLIPKAREIEAIVFGSTQQGDAVLTIVLRFQSLEHGVVLVNTHRHIKKISYQVAMERPERFPQLHPMLRGWTYETPDLEITCLGASVLKNGHKASILADLVRTHEATPGLNLRV
ncbi:MAG: hypothetical protein ACLFQR_07480 [Desulfovibrionales bacterium]